MIGAGGRGKFGKEAREIRVRLDAIGSGGFDQRYTLYPSTREARFNTLRTAASAVFRVLLRRL